MHTGLCCSPEIFGCNQVRHSQCDQNFCWKRVEVPLAWVVPCLASSENDPKQMRIIELLCSVKHVCPLLGWFYIQEAENHANFHWEITFKVGKKNVQISERGYCEILSSNYRSGPICCSSKCSGSMELLIKSTSLYERMENPNSWSPSQHLTTVYELRSTWTMLHQTLPSIRQEEFRWRSDTSILELGEHSCTRSKSGLKRQNLGYPFPFRSTVNYHLSRQCCSA